MSAIEIEILGIVAALLINGAMLPQILKTVRTKQVGGISLPFWVVMFTGACLWTAYGILAQVAALILSSAATCTLCLTMVALILRYR
jgi:MtN3 and saliva related transmembrane protein